MQHRRQMDADEMDRRTPPPPPKFIDLKLPLPWILASAFAIVLFMGVLINKVDNIGSSVAKLEVKIDSKDEKLNMVLSGVTEVKAENKIQDAKIQNNANDILDLKRNVQDLQLSRVRLK